MEKRQNVGTKSAFTPNFNAPKREKSNLTKICKTVVGV